MKPEQLRKELAEYQPLTVDTKAQCLTVTGTFYGCKLEYVNKITEEEVEISIDSANLPQVILHLQTVQAIHTVFEQS